MHILTTLEISGTDYIFTSLGTRRTWPRPQHLRSGSSTYMQVHIISLATTDHVIESH